MLNAGMQPIGNLALYSDGANFYLYKPARILAYLERNYDKIKTFFMEDGFAMLRTQETNSKYNTVGYSSAKHGYGPTVYTIALQELYPRGLASDTTGNTNSEAANIWNNFLDLSNGGYIEKHERLDHPEYDCPACNGAGCVECDGGKIGYDYTSCCYYYTIKRNVINTTGAKELNRRVMDLIEKHLTKQDFIQMIYGVMEYSFGVFL